MDTLAYLTLTDEATGNDVLIPVADILRVQASTGFSTVWFKSGGLQTVQETPATIYSALDTLWDEAYLRQQLVRFGDGSYDAFSRLRVSAVEGLFDAQLTYDLQPLLFEAIVAESGAAIAHDATNRQAALTFADTPTCGKAYMQSYEHFRYQPGKSQIVFVTFNMVETKADTLKFAGYSDGSNGIEFQLSGTTKQFTIYSDTTLGDETVAQTAWNLDPLNGTGPSGITLDIATTQILVIDFQALYVGRVRVGFDIGGAIIYAHEFNHSNLVANPYIQTANLPIRCGMTCTGTVSTTMKFICCAVQSEGGTDDTSGYNFSAEGTATAASAADTHILSIQPATTFNSIVNRAKVQLDDVVITVTGANPVLWKLCVGQALTSTSVAAVNATYSGVSTIAGTLSGAPAVVLAQGYVAATNRQKESISHTISHRYPITLNAAGAVRDLGRLTMLVNGVGGTSATRCVFNWHEVR